MGRAAPRCVNPNSTKRAEHFEDQKAVEQVPTPPRNHRPKSPGLAGVWGHAIRAVEREAFRAARADALWARLCGVARARCCAGAEAGPAVCGVRCAGLVRGADSWAGGADSGQNTRAAVWSRCCCCEALTLGAGRGATAAVRRRDRGRQDVPRELP
eukprot:3011061-Rhodomonas_salina.1